MALCWLETPILSGPFLLSTSHHPGHSNATLSILTFLGEEGVLRHPSEETVLAMPRSESKDEAFPGACCPGFSSEVGVFHSQCPTWAPMKAGVGFHDGQWV